MTAPLVILSFAYARGDPPEASLLFDMRFLRNPHWDEALRPLCGLDDSVGTYIARDVAYDDAIEGIETLLVALLPLYLADDKRPVRIAFGCTGGRHRSVHVAERIAGRLRTAGFSPTLEHRDLAAPPSGGLARSAGAGRTAAKVIG